MQDTKGLKGLSPERLELLARMARKKKEQAAGGAPVERRGIEPLPRKAGEENAFEVSWAQERLWFLDAVEPELIAYNEPSLTRIRGPFDPEALAVACGRVVARHEVLRTRFELRDGAPEQVVAPPAEGPASLPVEDLAHLAADEAWTEAHRQAVEMARRPFDLEQGPLLRMVLYRLAPEDHLLLVVFHHIAADGWSYYVFLRELALAYEAYRAGEEPTLPVLSVQYADYAAWQRRWLAGGRLDRQLDYWRRQLEGVPHMLELPIDKPRPARPRFVGSQIPLRLPDTLYGRLERLAEERGVTFVVVLLAAYQVLLARLSGADDLVVGMPVAGRNRTELEGLVGFFVNTVVIRARLSDDTTVGQLLETVSGNVLGALAHQDLPFDLLVQELQVERVAGAQPLFQAMLAFQNEIPGRLEVSGLSFDRQGIDIGTTKFDLNANLWQQDGRLEGWLEYSTELFDGSTPRRMVRQLRNLLAALVDGGVDRPLVELSLLDAAERHQLAYEWNDTRVERAGDPCLHELVAAQAARTPGAEALRFETPDGPGSLTYAELRQRAHALACRLRAEGVGPEMPVGVMLERSPELVIALLAVLEAGGAWLPLDPSYPAERLAFFIEDGAPRRILTVESLRAGVPASAHDRLLLLDDGNASPHDRAEAPPLPAVDPEALAYIVYTSGSTGRPKGSMNAHRGLVNRIRWMIDACRLDENERFLQKTPIGFDVSLWELFVPLSVGACLVLARPGGHRDPVYLMRTLKGPGDGAEGVTTVHFVPSMLRAFLDAEGHPDYPALRRVVTSGEALTQDLARDTFERLGDVELLNLYGPTETAIEVTGWRVERDELERAIPIGRALDNLAMRVLDRRGLPTAIGVSGELHIGGMAVGRGYHGRPALTAERFVPDPLAEEPGARLYRTGDRVRWRSDGAIEYHGRLDFQVKLRGVRIELGEIEATLRSLPTINEAVVGLEEHAGDPRLVAWVVPAAGESVPDLPELRAALLRTLPEAMVPSAFVALDAMPLNPSGKTDRKALRSLAPDLGMLGRGERVAPRSELEEQLHHIWAEVLHLDPERFGVEDDFFALGGHSLLVTRVAARLRRDCGVELPLRRVFEVTTLAELAVEVEAARRLGLGGAPAIDSVRREEPPRLSFAQERLWFLDQLAPGSVAYNIPGALRIRGPLDVARLSAALAAIVRRHEVLRTTYASRDGMAIQVVIPPEEVAAPELEPVVLDTFEPSVREAEMGRLAREEAAAPFELEAGPVIRYRLLRLASEDHVVLVTLHHIAGDGWSLGVLVGELAELYRALGTGEEPALEPLAVQYADYAAWQREWLAGEALEEQLTFWRERLSEAPLALDLPTDRPRPAMETHVGETLRFTLSPELYRGLEAVARRSDATLFAVLLAAFEALLFRETRQHDLLVGSPVAGRTHREVEGLIGLFVNTLVMRAEMDAALPFSEHLRRVRDHALDAFSHQDLPFERLVEALQGERDPSRPPLVQVLFAFQNRPRERFEIQDLALERIELDPGASKLELSLLVSEEEDRLEAAFEYKTDLFDGARIRRLADHLERLLSGVVADPERSLGELPVLGPAERHQVLVEWNDTAVEHGEALCLHQLFEARVDRDPVAVALEFEGETLTYGELEQRANRLANHLRTRGVGPEVLVGVLLERSVDMVVSLLAISKAGGAYLPLDPSYPAERLAFFVADGRPRMVLTHDAMAGLLGDGGAPVLCLDREAETLASVTDERPVEPTASPDRLAYVIYTSGSTGRPKGAMNTHRAIVNRLRWILRAGHVGPTDRVLQKTPFSFDVSVWEFFAPLAAGARLVVARPEGHKDPGYLRHLIDSSAITVLHFVPSMLRAFLDSAAGWQGHGVRRVKTSGEALTRDLVERFDDCFPEAELHNLYGPTEAAVDVTGWPCRDPGVWPVMPIGRPLDNMKIHLFAGAEPAAIGVAGELLIGGVAVGRGYWDRPALTAERFVPDPLSDEPGARLYRSGDLARYRADGAIEFLGRIDHQVKLRGFRIELGEIDHALGEQPGVKTAVTLLHEKRQQLVAYLVTDEERPSIARLREALADRLPEYMVPTAWVFLDRLPLLTSGKVNRKALPEPEAPSAEEGLAPRNPWEEMLATTWSELLGLEGLGVRQNLFDLGAHSLLATQAKSRIDRELGIDLPLRRLFELPTIERQAIEVERLRQGGTVTAPPAIPRVPRDTAPPASFSQQRLWFFDRWEPGSAVFNIPARVRFEGPLSPRRLRAGLEAVVRRHEVLRTRFAEHDGTLVQIIDEPSAMPLPLVDLSGLDARQSERRLSVLEQALAAHAFDLEQGPLVRCWLFRLAPEHHVAVLVLHHIIADGWSLQVLARELSVLYEAQQDDRPSPLAPLPIQYADYAAWQRDWLRGERLEQQLDFWRAQLAGAPDALDLPFDRPRRPVQGFRGDRREQRLPAALVSPLRRLARDSGSTLFMVLITAWKVLLARLAGQDDLSVGTLIANRQRSEIEGLIGFFLNTLVLRSRLDRRASFRQLLDRVRETTLDVYAHQDLPFEKLVQAIDPERHMSLTPLFQVLFILQNTPPAELELPGLRLSVEEIERGTVNYDLLFALVEEGDELVGLLDYDVDLFDATTIARMLGQYEQLLGAMVADPAGRWAEASLLGPAERHQLVVELNDTAALPPVEAERGFYPLFLDRAEHEPEATAASCGDRRLSYGELAERSARGATALAEVAPFGEAVPILADRGLDFLSAILSLAHLGSAYLPLDPAHPDRRLGQILGQAGCRLLLVSESYADRVETMLATLEDDRRPEVRIVEELFAELDETTETVAVRAPSPADLAYVIFTSGSTGVPKGVMIDHRGMLNHFWANLEVLDMGPDDVLAQNASQCFDISVWQFLAPLVIGAEVRIVPDEVAHDPLALLRETESAGITVLELVPSLLGAMLGAIEAGTVTRPDFAALRWLIPTGEALPPSVGERWLAEYPAIPLLNAYGPAECSDDVSLEPIRRTAELATANVSIGRPVRNLRMLLLDRELAPVPLGVVGEIAVAGIGVGRGYLGDPRRTAEVFVPDPFAAVGGAGEPGARLYKSGDLGRMRADGRIEFQGRVDHQVKIRGFRIETGEIETVLRHHPEVDEAVVVARRDDGPASARLVAYLTREPALGTSRPQAAAATSTEEATPTLERRLRPYLAEQLPDYMVPALFVVLDELPLNANGKIDLAALPAPDAVLAERPRVAPRTETERVLAAIWAEILGLEDPESLGVEDSFFALGGHSLLATQVVSRVRGALGVELPLRDLFETADLAALAERIETARMRDDASSEEPILPAGEEDADRLSFAQERLWFLDQFDPGSAAYNLPNAVSIEGALDPEVLERTLNAIIERHDTLRMTFVGTGGQPRQIVHDTMPLVLGREDLSHLGCEEAEAETRRLAVADAALPFDLEEGPLIRATLLRLGESEHVLLISMHHIVSDGWSMGVLLAEVAAIYPAFAAGQPSPLEPLPIQYPDYGAWQRRQLSGEQYERQLAYWREQLDDAPPAMDLPSRSTAFAEADLGRGAATWFHLPADLSAGVRRLGQERQATLFMTLLSAFAGVLARYTGAEDLMVGVPIAGRNRTELEALIGFFVNTLVLRIDLGESPSSEELLERVRRHSLDAFTHQDLPFEKLVAELNPDRDLERSTLFQVMFALQNTPVGSIELPDLTFRRLEIDSGTARFELYLELTENDDHLDGMVQYSLDRFEAPFVERFVGHYRSLLEGMVAHPDRALTHLPLLSAPERRQLLGEWNATTAEVPLETPFQQLFAETAIRFPERLAVVCEDRRLTYAELALRARGVARELSRHGVGRDHVVAVMALRDLDFLTAAVGAFLAGAAYLPLDPKHPPGRVRRILEQSRTTMVLCAGGLLPLVEEAVSEVGEGAPPRIELEPLLGEAPRLDDAIATRRLDPAMLAPVPADPENLAYVIFTSGSTGVPKGAMLPQRGFVNHLFAMIEELDIEPDDVVAQTASQCFDISVWQFLNPLVLGARVQIYPDEVAHDPALLLDRVESDRVTLLEIVPSLLRLMLEEIERRGDARPALDSLRYLIPTGEAIPPELCRAWYAVYPEIPLINVYGPAECSDDVSFYRIPAGRELERLRAMPIGKPTLNTELYVLDRRLEPLPVGVAGELCIGGSGVGRGYLHDPLRTAGVFVPHPLAEGPGRRLYRSGDLARWREDGELEFLGRIDHQVKIRGLRLELGEIEAVLGEHPELAASVVVAQPEGSDSGRLRLVGFVVPRPGAEAPEPAELRAFLERELPAYAVPSAWKVLDELPLNANGKVDRKALPMLDGEATSQAEYVAPRDEMEEAVAEIFAAIIGRERVGVFDNFFDLGGHSLLATQAIWQLREAFGVELALRSLFEAPTVAELVGVIEAAVIEQIEDLDEAELDALLEDEDLDLEDVEDLDVDDLDVDDLDEGELAASANESPGGASGDTTSDDPSRTELEEVMSRD